MPKDKALKLRKHGRAERNTWFWGYVFIAPVMIGVTIFLIAPLLYAFYLSVTDWDGFTTPHFIGLQNFVNLFKDPNLAIEFRNTIVYMIGTVPIMIFLAAVTAVLLNADIKGKSFFRVAFFLPNVTMATAIATVWRSLYNSRYGLVNMLTRLFGWDPMWLGDPKLILPAVIIVAIWSGIGYAAIILLAGLQNIPSSYYEAAQIDGASNVRQFFTITLPLLSPSLFFVTVTSMISAFKAFDLIFMFAGGGDSASNGPMTQAVRTMVFGVYQQGFTLMHMGYAAAEAVILFAIIMAVTAFQFWAQKKVVIYD